MHKVQVLFLVWSLSWLRFKSCCIVILLGKCVKTSVIHYEDMDTPTTLKHHKDYKQRQEFCGSILRRTVPSYPT